MSNRDISPSDEVACESVDELLTVAPGVGGTPFRPTSTHLQTPEVTAAIDFVRLLGHLKTTPRTGWVRRGVPKYESVADHSWRVATMSLLLPEEFDISKCMALGLVHDLAESLIGDICPGDNISKENKARMEEEAMKKIASTLSRASIQFNNDTTGNSVESSSSDQKLLDLFHEYEKRESKEAIAVKDLDLLDMIVQAAEYEERFGLDLSEFFEGTPVSRFKTPAIQMIAIKVNDQREARKKQENEELVRLQTNLLSKSDAAFVAEFSKGSSLSCDDVERIVTAMRDWESNISS